MVETGEYTAVMKAQSGSVADGGCVHGLSCYPADVPVL